MRCHDGRAGLPNGSQGSLGTIDHLFQAEDNTVTVTVTNRAHVSSSGAFHVAADPSVVGTVNNFKAKANTRFDGQLVATFTDPAGAESVYHYSATIDWGDDTAKTSATIDQMGSIFTVSGGHT